jgi:hypothetical protein
MTDRIREGVSLGVNDAMNAVNADVLREDNILFRTCEHGVRHPVGNLGGRLTADEEWLRRHHHRSAGPFQVSFAECCACCADWPKAL